MLTTAVVAFMAGVAVDGWLRVYGPPQPDAAELSQPPRPSQASGAVSAASDRGLRVPIDGTDVESMKGGFSEPRTGHSHEAVDILAPRNTPVHAVDDGSIAKLFVSKAGGLTIYQFDPDQRLCYYYAHLERYAQGLRDGASIRRGEVIGYVGTSGNAPKNTPHLHFAVFQLDANKRWWEGTAIDPYQVFKRAGQPSHD